MRRLLQRSGLQRLRLPRRMRWRNSGKCYPSIRFQDSERVSPPFQALFSILQLIERCRQHLSIRFFVRCYRLCRSQRTPERCGTARCISVQVYAFHFCNICFQFFSRRDLPQVQHGFHQCLGCFVNRRLRGILIKAFAAA